MIKLTAEITGGTVVQGSGTVTSVYSLDGGASITGWDFSNLITVQYGWSNDITSNVTDVTVSYDEEGNGRCTISYLSRTIAISKGGNLKVYAGNVKIFDGTVMEVSKNGPYRYTISAESGFTDAMAEVKHEKIQQTLGRIVYSASGHVIDFDLEFTTLDYRGASYTPTRQFSIDMTGLEFLDTYVREYGGTYHPDQGGEIRYYRSGSETGYIQSLSLYEDKILSYTETVERRESYPGVIVYYQTYEKKYPETKTETKEWQEGLFHYKERTTKVGGFVVHRDKEQYLAPMADYNSLTEEETEDVYAVGDRLVRTITTKHYAIPMSSGTPPPPSERYLGETTSTEEVEFDQESMAITSFYRYNVKYDEYLGQEYITYELSYVWDESTSTGILKETSYLWTTPWGFGEEEPKLFLANKTTKEEIENTRRYVPLAKVEYVFKENAESIGNASKAYEYHATLVDNAYDAYQCAYRLWSGGGNVTIREVELFGIIPLCFKGIEYIASATTRRTRLRYEVEEA